MALLLMALLLTALVLMALHRSVHAPPEGLENASEL